MTEQHRHRCEVRQIIRWRSEHGDAWVRAWLADVAKRRGDAAAQRLRSDAWEQVRAGNTGAAIAEERAQRRK